MGEGVGLEAHGHEGVAHEASRVELHDEHEGVDVVGREVGGVEGCGAQELGHYRAREGAVFGDVDGAEELVDCAGAHGGEGFGASFEHEARVDADGQLVFGEGAADRGVFIAGAGQYEGKHRKEYSEEFRHLAGEGMRGWRARGEGAQRLL